MLRLSSYPGMEPKHSLLQQTTTAVPYCPMRYQRVQQFICTATLTSFCDNNGVPSWGAPFNNNRTFYWGQTIQQLEDNCGCASRKTTSGLSGKATAVTTIISLANTCHTPGQTRPWGWATVWGVNRDRVNVCDFLSFQTCRVLTCTGTNKKHLLNKSAYIKDIKGNT